MKQFIILIIVLFVLIVSGYLEIKYINDSANYILADINYLDNAVNNNNFELANASISQTERTWNEMKNVWAIFIDHRELDDIEESLINYKGYIKTKDVQMAKVNAGELIMLFEHIKESNSIKMENIF